MLSKILRLVFDPISVSDKKNPYTVLTTYESYVIGLCKKKHAMH